MNSPEVTDKIFETLSGLPIVVIVAVVFIFFARWWISWVFLPWLLLSRLKKMHETMGIMRADLAAVRRIVDGRLPGEAKGSAVPMPGSDNPFEL